MSAKELHTNNDLPVSGALPALQPRSQKTRDAILAAMAEKLTAGSLERATVQEIANAAGVSVGAFYGRYKNKDAATVALFNMRRARLIEKFNSITENAKTLSGWSKKMTAAAMTHAFENRALIAHAAQQNDAIQAVQNAARNDSIAFANHLARHLKRLAPKLPEKELSSVAGFSLAMLGGMTRDAAVFSSSLLGEDAAKKWFSKNLSHSVETFIRSRETETN